MFPVNVSLFACTLGNVMIPINVSLFAYSSGNIVSIMFGNGFLLIFKHLSEDCIFAIGRAILKTVVTAVV